MMNLSTQHDLSAPGSALRRPTDTGFELGWDYAHYAAVPPADHLHPLSPVRQGWEAGRECFGRRTLQHNRFVRKWLQLRLGAWLRGRAFEGTQVNPAFLRRIDVAHCPITREVLTHGTGELSDASVDRVCNRAGYAAGNLAVMSARANRAKGACGFAEAMAFARRLELDGGSGQVGGLAAAAWARIGVLASFVTPMPHGQAAALPLLVLPPRRLRVLNPAQSLQVMLSLQLGSPGHARRCAALAGLMPSAETRHALESFMHTLLARRVAAGRLACDMAERRALEDLWRDPLVNQRWQRLALRLTAGECEAISHKAADRGLAGPGVRWLPAEAATEGWALETAGYAVVPTMSEAVAEQRGQAETYLVKVATRVGASPVSSGGTTPYDSSRPTGRASLQPSAVGMSPGFMPANSSATE